MIWEIDFQFFENHVINIQNHFHQNTLTPRKRRFRTGGKPSTWFPPGGLVEHISDDQFLYKIQIAF